MSVKPQEVYLQMQVNTASPQELTLLLYNGLIKFLGQSLEETKHGNYEGKNNHIIRSLDILDELLMSLDQSYEVAQQLGSLYLFMKSHLVEANIKNKAENIEFCIGQVKELRDTWAQAIKLAKQKQV
ncbi:hypothetical protein SD71_06795 [Cohnella kolymensis]|uniref:Flagellar secretion chaperone FliS n=1 Tax=Cohnella kolymensis TaxID=1590652 RepID=A0ABR5A6N3_9BACL|nr:flagellar export chaperone FliS [Cohnella kolymensis]KIL36701.1 hypothetical protein SD71_06795 [Cohnella kolymensis]